jgi:hypothetical protein
MRDKIIVNVLGQAQQKCMFMRALAQSGHLIKQYDPEKETMAFFNLNLPGDQVAQLWDHGYEADMHRLEFKNSHAVIYCIDTDEQTTHSEQLQLIADIKDPFTTILLCRIPKDLNKENNAKRKSTLDRLFDDVKKLSKNYIEQKERASKITALSDIRATYRQAGGSLYRTHSIFGFFSNNKISDIAQHLIKRTTQNESGASAVTLKKYPCLNDYKESSITPFSF